VVDALENASSWAFRDTIVSLAIGNLIDSELQGSIPNGQAVEQGILELRSLHDFWSIDGENIQSNQSGTSEHRTATQWALELNKDIQGLWDGVLGEILRESGQSNLVEVADRQVQLSDAVQQMRIALAQAGLSSVPYSATNLTAEYRLDANASSNPAAAAALAELEAAVAAIQLESLETLTAAHEAFITANEARSAGQKVFFSSVGNNLVSQAADLADRANIATNGIVGAAYTIGQTYYSSHDAVREAGLLPAVLNNGRDLNSDGGGTRPGGGGGQ
jgi:hypothetical protein